jgi:hypothetical protein
MFRAALWRDEFPANITGLVLGIFAMASIALSGLYTQQYWPLSERLTQTFRIIGWVLAGVLFLLLLWRIRKGINLQLKQVLLGGALLAVPFFLTQPILAGDLYAYVAEVKITAIGNPYVLPPAALGNNQILSGVAPVWQNQPSAYGPLWNIIDRGLAAVTTDAVALIYIFRLLNLAGILLCTWIITRYTSSKHAALIAFNPIVLVEVIGDGHHDLLIGLAILAAVAWLQRPIRSALALAAGAAIKFIPLITLPALIASLPSKRRWQSMFWIVGFPAAVLIFCFAFFWVGPQTLDGIRQQAALFSHPIFFPQFLVYIFAFLFNSKIHPEVLARAIGAAVFVVIYGWVCVAAWNKKITGIAAVAFALAAYIFFAAPYVQTWYLLWLLPLLALLSTKQAVRWVGVASIVWAAMLLVHI